MALDLSKLPNPYDFANPVNDPGLFAGRSEQLQEIRYYLDQAQIAVRPMNMAVVGERASGKTSVLNMIEIEARKRDCCVVRADLDEGDAVSQLGFFYKLFDAVLTAACESGAYGGLDAQTYDTYRDMMDAYKIPDEREFCPFIFPIQYARCMSSGNVGASLSDSNYRRDMSEIQKQLDRTVILLLDECDTLTQSRVHLQKLRNIFMNTRGFMLVFTGTPDLFPLIDDVFSPIIRQFKKLQIGPFDKRDDTEACITKPLESIGITHPREIMSAETFRDVSEVHDVSGGRPYEIQLICHTMFRRVQEGRARRMELSLDVLDDVRRELEATQDVSLRPVLNAVRRLTEAELQALRELCAASKRATFDQIWFAERTFEDEQRWTEQTLRAHATRFEEAGIIKINEGVIEFAGDDFDRIYCKYLARKQKISLAIAERPYEVLLRLRLQASARRKAEGIRPLLFSTVDEPDPSSIDGVSRALADAERDEPIDLRPGSIADRLYWCSVDFRDAATFQLAYVKLTSPWTSVGQWFRCMNRETASQRPLETLAPALAEPAERATAHGGSIEIEILDFPVVRPEQLAIKVEQSGDGLVRGIYSSLHEREMEQAYLQKHEVPAAVLHGDLAYRYRPTLPLANNLGYIYLASDDLVKATELLEAAASLPDQLEFAPGLLQYNLGILKAKKGNLEEAHDHLNLAIQKSESASDEIRKCSRLVIPRATVWGQDLEFEEVTEPDLTETARAALSVVKEVLAKK